MLSKNVFFVFLFLFAIVLTVNVSASSVDCFQEQANVATDCGGLDNGSYSLGAFTQLTLIDSENFTDADYSTQTRILLDTPNHISANVSYFVNYTIPLNATNVSVFIKDVLGNNQTLPIRQDCFNDSSILCLKYSYAYSENLLEGKDINSYKLSCWIDAGFALNSPTSVINSVEYSDLNIPFHYEEAVIWNIDSCTYSGSGDWAISLSDDCVVSDATVVSGDLIISGDAGSVVFSESVSANGFSFEPDDFDGDASVSFVSGATLGVLV